jgi:uncharacterized membrane protein
MLETLALALSIVGWILVIVGWVLKFSYNRKKDELKREVSIICFFTAMGLFLISLVISLILI